MAGEGDGQPAVRGEIAVVIARLLQLRHNDLQLVSVVEQIQVQYIRLDLQLPQERQIFLCHVQPDDMPDLVHDLQREQILPICHGAQPLQPPGLLRVVHRIEALRIVQHEDAVPL